MFLLSVDCSGDEKTREFISKILHDAIEKVGTYSVVQVLTDNAANCKKVGYLITVVHPHILWSGCMTHTLSLFMKDIANPPKNNPELGSELAFVADVYGGAEKVVDYIKHHSLAQYIFRSFLELDVIQTKKTRFRSHYIMLEHIVHVKRHLINMVLSEEWAKIKKGRSKQNTNYEQVRRTILDEDFWENAKFVLSFTKPIWLMIRFCDSDKSAIGLVYPKMRIVLEKIKTGLANHAEIREAMEKLVISRWEMMNQPLHCLAYVLNPYFHLQAWLKEISWSTYSYIHSVKRNNLNSSLAETLVSIDYNPRVSTIICGCC